MAEEKQRLEINWVQATAGSLTALTSAVLLSTVGVAGTLVGAAIGSALATIGNAVYSHYLRTTKERIAAAHATARTKVASAQGRVGAASAGMDESPTYAGRRLDEAGEELREAEAELRDAEAAPERTPWREVLTGLPWKRITGLTAALFVVTMLIILAFELTTGRALATYTGGTDDMSTRTSLFGSSSTDRQDDPAPDSGTEQDAPDPAPAEEYGEEVPAPAEETTEPVPEEEAEATPTPTPTATEPAPEPAPSEMPEPAPEPVEPTE